METSRLIQIINFLLITDNAITVKEISEKIGCSEKTIRNDFCNIESLISKYNLRLIKKARVGIWIDGTNDDKKELLKSVNEKKLNFVEFTSKQRKDFIIKKILNSKSKVYIEYLCMELGCSKSTIRNDISDIEKKISKFNLSVDNVDGIKILGNELDIRKLYTNIFSQNILTNDLFNNLNDEIKNKIKNIVIDWSTRVNIPIKVEYLENITFHILLSMHRILNNKVLDDEMLDIGIGIKDKDLDLKIKKLINTLSNVSGVIIPQSEIKYIKLHITSMLLETNYFKTSEISNSYQEISKFILNEFINCIEYMYSFNLANNKKFVESMLIHFMPMLYRINNNLNLYNPLLEEIKENYSSSFVISSTLNGILEKHINKTASEEEIAFVALHLSLAMEGVKKLPVIAIICPMGRGISRFINIKLQEKFKDCIFINCSLDELDFTSRIDMIITTVKIDTKYPSVLINPNLSYIDYEKISNQLSKIINKNVRLFSQRSLFVFDNKCSKEKILFEMYKSLYIQDFVKDTFLNDLNEREKLSSTEIGNGIVLTHGYHSSVVKSQISLSKLNKPIIWNSEEVNIIVMLAISKEDSVDITKMDWLYKMLNNKSKIKEIINAKDVIELHSVLESCI